MVETSQTEWITTAEAAEVSGYSLNHIRRLVREGRVRSKKFGRAWMVHRRSLESYAQEMERLGEEKHDPWRVGARKRSTKD
ncbi:MAG: helix-turn-helix domain-containing protein [Anaerolineae bacterium]|nr:helix-turn-helix domain-containing protein [Anaerolineae bacterium]